MPSATTTPHATRPAAWSPPRELGAAALRKWRALRPRDPRWAGGVVCCAAALVTAELISHRFRDFYKDRPLQAGFVTGVVLALLAYLVIDAVRANLNEKRWTPLSKLAFLALAAETTLVIDTLLSLVTGMRPDRARRTDAAQKDLQAALAAMGLKPWQGDDLGAVAHTEYRDQLVCVLSDRAWLALALREIGDRKWGNRDGLAKWAGAMLTIPEAANVFGRLARLNNFLSGLQEWLRALKGQSGYEHIPAS